MNFRIGPMSRALRPALPFRPPFREGLVTHVPQGEPSVRSASHALAPSMLRILCLLLAFTIGASLSTPSPVGASPSYLPMTSGQGETNVPPACGSGEGNSGYPAGAPGACAVFARRYGTGLSQWFLPTMGPGGIPTGTAIQNAINFAQGGSMSINGRRGEVQLPPCQFNVGTPALKVSESIDIIGRGMNATRLLQKAGDQALLDGFKPNSSLSLGIRGIHFDGDDGGDGTFDGNRGIRIQFSRYSEITCNKVTEFFTNGIVLIPQGEFSRGLFSDNNLIANNIVDGTQENELGDGIGVVGDGNSIIGNTVSNVQLANAITTFGGMGNLIQNNNISNSRTGIGIDGCLTQYGSGNPCYGKPDGGEQIMGNTISGGGNAVDGIVVWHSRAGGSGQGGGKVSGNLINGMAHDGILVSNSFSYTVNCNAVIGAGWTGIRIGTGSGEPASDNHVDNNLVSCSGDSGLKFDGTAHYNSYGWNTVYHDPAPPASGAIENLDPATNYDGGNTILHQSPCVGTPTNGPPCAG